MFCSALHLTIRYYCLNYMMIYVNPFLLFIIAGDPAVYQAWGYTHRLRYTQNRSDKGGVWKYPVYEHSWNQCQNDGCQVYEPSSQWNNFYFIKYHVTWWPCHNIFIILLILLYNRLFFWQYEYSYEYECIICHSVCVLFLIKVTSWNIKRF